MFGLQSVLDNKIRAIAKADEDVLNRRENLKNRLFVIQSRLSPQSKRKQKAFKMRQSRDVLEIEGIDSEITSVESETLIRYLNDVQKDYFTRQLEIKVVEFYWDWARFFPAWLENRDRTIPSSVTEIKSSMVVGEQSLEFSYEGHQFLFQHNIINASEGLGRMTLAIDGLVKVNLKVLREIGTLGIEEARLVDREGWADLFLRLYQEFLELSRVSGTQGFNLKSNGSDDHS